MAKNGNKSKANNVWKGKSLTTEKPMSAVSLIPKTENDLPYLTFSFRYVTQREWFGIGEQDAVWFASLQERLKDLSGKTSAILEDKNTREDYRLHPINWEAKNCPIKKEDLISVPKKILDAAEVDFFWQFQISKGTGRVVGFFNENNSIFYIVLLDPKHNIQPSKDYGYRVDATTIAPTDYERLQMIIADAERLRIACENVGKCPLSRIHEEYLNSEIFYACVDLDLRDKYRDLIESGRFQEKFEDFLLNEL